MIILKNIEIKNFRSIREARLTNLEDFSILAGLNNSGKSNFLRALNLFFTGKPEPDLPFDLMRDYYRGGLSARKRKNISISIQFVLPQLFKFRSELDSVERLLGRNFNLKKEWGFRQFEPTVYLNNSNTPLGLEDTVRINQFLALISFRYIPNRVMPIDIIRKEQQALRDVLVRRLARFKTQSAAMFEGLQKTAEGLIGIISDDVKKFAPDIKRLRMATAASLADLAFHFGYKLQEGQVEMDESEQGSGMQSLLMFETLHLIDRDYFQQFGWKQAAIWAIEEPESSLNTALEARIAHFLSRISKESSGRLQVIGTTHSDLMIQYSGSGYYVEKVKVDTKAMESIAAAKPTREMIECAARFGVSRWVNPILLYPLEPIVLVEGKFDRDFLNQCFKASRFSNPPRVTCLEDVKNDPGKGGVETLYTFVKENIDVIRTRHSFAKVVVLLDYDAASRVAGFSSMFKSSDPFVVMAWDVSDANPNQFLSQNCKGVERFYSDPIVDKARKDRPELFFTNHKGVEIIRKEDSQKFKSALNKVVNRGLLGEEAKFAKALVQRLVASNILK